MKLTFLTSIFLLVSNICVGYTVPIENGWVFNQKESFYLQSSRHSGIRVFSKETICSTEQSSTQCLEDVTKQYYQSNQIRLEANDRVQDRDGPIRTFQNVFYAFVLSDGTAFTFEDTENGFAVSRGSIYSDVAPREIFETESEMAMRPVLSSDGSMILIGTEDGTAYVMSSEDGDIVRTYGNNARLQGGGFSSDKSMVIIARLDNTVKVWDVETGRPIQSIDVRGRAIGGVISEDGSRIWSLHEDVAREWSLSSGNLISEFEGIPVPTENVVAAATNPNADEIRYITQRGEADEWSFQAQRLTSRTNLGNRVERGFIDHRTGYVIVVFENQSRPEIMYTEEEKEMSKTINHENVQAATFSPDGSMFVTISENENAKVWSMPPN